MAGDAGLADRILARMAAPAIVAPMFLVSSPQLVIESCRAGLIGSMPTLNARTVELLDAWLEEIGSALSGSEAAPYAMNMVAHSSNKRFDADLDVVVKHRVPIVISSVGNPARVVDKVHEYGGLVFSDAASIKHARRGVEAGVDALVLLCGGAGGHTGWLNPFAFVEEVRQFFEGPIALAGGLSNGRQLRALQSLGADFGFMGTRFLAAEENNASAEYRDMVVASGADDILLTSEVSGMPANMLRLSVERAGFKEKSAPSGAFDVSAQTTSQKAWRDVWGGGHGIGSVKRVEPAKVIADRLVREYREFRSVKTS